MKAANKYRLSIAYMVFAEVELDADTPAEAERLLSSKPAHRKFETVPFVHRVEVRVFSKPGEHRWEEVPR